MDIEYNIVSTMKEPSQKQKFRRDMLMDEKEGCMIFSNSRKVAQIELIDIKEVIPNASDRLKFYDLSHYINKEDNTIFYIDGHGTKRYADEIAIAEILDCSEDSTRRFLRRMIDLGIYKKVKEKTGKNKVTKFYVNPLYYQATKFVSVELYDMFEEYLFDYTPSDMREFYSMIRKNKENGIIEELELLF